MHFPPLVCKFWNVHMKFMCCELGIAENLINTLRGKCSPTVKFINSYKNWSLQFEQFPFFIQNLVDIKILRNEIQNSKLNKFCTKWSKHYSVRLLEKFSPAICYLFRLLSAQYTQPFSLSASSWNWFVPLSIDPIFSDISTYGLTDKVAICHSFFPFFIKRCPLLWVCGSKFGQILIWT